MHERTPVPAAQLQKKSPPVWTQDRGTVLVAIGEEGGCSEAHAEVAEQNAQQVRLVLVEEIPEPSGICTMDLRYPPLAVRLDAPLEQREVIVERRQTKVPKQ